MEETELLYDHYKDTFSHLKAYRDQRDMLTVLSTIGIAVVYLSFFLPSDFDSVSKTILENKLTVKLSDCNVLESLILFVVLVLIMKYFQVNIFIQRQYDYIHKIEKKLSSKLVNVKIEREGKEYLKNYPLILSTADFIYKIGFPILLISSMIFKWIQCLKGVIEFKLFSLFMFNSVIIFTIISLTLLYLSWIHFEDFKKKNEG